MPSSKKTTNSNFNPGNAILRQQVILGIMNGSISLDAVAPLLDAAPTVTEAPTEPATPLATYYAAWEDEVTTGPADLYQYLAAAALSEHMPILNDLSEQTRSLVYDAVRLAVDVACRAANVSESWDGLYQTSTEHLRK